MLRNIFPFDRAWLRIQRTSFSSKAVVSFVNFLERRFGAKLVYDSALLDYESLDMLGLLEFAEILCSRGVIRSYKKNGNFPDEPKMAHWSAEYFLGGDKFDWAGGSSVDNHHLAFTKMLAEAIERHAWFTHDGFSFFSATLADMEKKVFLHPKRFVGYSDLQRENNSRLEIKPNDTFSYVKGYSWTQKTSSWVPIQIVSGHKNFRAFSYSSKEPAIRSSITTGLATHPVRTSAIVSGSLEVIERDAYMITWLNQLSLPRIDLAELSSRSDSLVKLLHTCNKYRFQTHAVRLLTDAPTHPVCVILEDVSGSLPRFSIGLKAHQNPAVAVEGALLEALRMHQTARKQKLIPINDWNPSTNAIDITHHNRLMYWSEEGRADHLNFLIKGEILPLRHEIWENDSDEEHLSRIINWCQEKGYELASVNFNNALSNVPKWNIEFVVIPELQPMYFDEKLPQIEGKRLKDVPRQFGYEPREPYREHPHPFL